MNYQNENEFKEKSVSTISKREELYNPQKFRSSILEDGKNNRTASSKQEKHENAHNNDNLSLKDNAFGDPSNTLKKVLQKMIDVKKSNIHLSKSILIDKTSIIKKEKLLSELSSEIRHFKVQNEKLREDLENTEKIKAKCEKNEKGVKAYCNTLRGKFKDFVETVS
jgi:hypothetical protein